MPVEKTINDEDVSNVDVVESMSELKVIMATEVCRSCAFLDLFHRTSSRPSTLPSVTRTSARFRISSNNSKSEPAKSAHSMQPSIALRALTRSSRCASFLRLSLQNADAS